MIGISLQITFDPQWYAAKDLIKQLQIRGKTDITTKGKMSFKKWVLQKISVVAEEAIKISRNIIKNSMPGGTGRTLEAARVLNKTIDENGVTVGLFDGRKMKALSHNGSTPYWVLQENGGEELSSGAKYYKMKPAQRRAIAAWYAKGKIPNEIYRYPAKKGYARYPKAKQFVWAAYSYLKDKTIKIDYCDSYLKYLAAGYVRKIVDPADWNTGFTTVVNHMKDLYEELN